MLGAGIVAEARLFVEESEVSAVDLQAADNASETRTTVKGKFAGVRHSRLRHVARAGSGNGPALALAASTWTWQPRFRFFTPTLGGRAVPPFVRSIVLATPGLRAPPRG